MEKGFNPAAEFEKAIASVPGAQAFVDASDRCNQAEDWYGK